MSHQQTMALGMSNQPSMKRRGQEEGPLLKKFSKQVPFAALLPIVEPHIDKDKAMQLQALYGDLKKQDISKDVFIRKLRTVAGDQILKMAVHKLQTQVASSAESSSVKIQSQKASSTGQLQVSLSEKAATVLQGSSQTASRFLPERQTSSDDGIIISQSRQDLVITEPIDQHLSRLELQNDQQAFSEIGDNQLTSMGIHNDQTMATTNHQTMNSGIKRQLDKENETRLHTLYLKTQRKEISKDEFVQQLGSIIEDELSKVIAPELQTQATSNVQDSAAQSVDL